MPAKLKDSLVLNGIFDVCKFLLDENAISDDSILHSLVDLINKYLNNAEDLEQSGLQEFFDEISKHCDGHEPIIVGFALQVAETISQKDAIYPDISSTIYNLLENVWSNKDVYSHLIIRTTFYKCIHSLAKNRSQLTWIVNNHQEYLDHGLVELEEGASVFLQSVVLDVLSCVLASDVHSSVDGDQMVLNCQQTLLQSIVKHVHHHVEPGSCSKPGSSRLVLSCLQVLEKACQGSESVTQSCVQMSHLVPDVQHIILASDERLSTQAMSLLAVWLKKRCVTARTVAATLLEELLQSGNDTRMRKLAVLGLKSDIATDDRYVEILLTPIRRFLASTDAATKAVDSVENQSISRSTFTNGICTAISAFKETKLPIPDVMSQLFSRTHSTGHGSSSSLAYIINNKKIQRLCMEYFLEVTEIAEAEKDTIVPSILAVMTSLSPDSMVYTSCVNCLLPHVTYLVQKTSLAETLASIIQRHLCALQWELRDTTLEFLANLLKQYGGEANVVKWFLSNRLHAHIWSCVSDGESYVRASALTALSNMVATPDMWRQLLETVQLSEEELVEKIVTIFKEDTEAFARRSAGTFLSHYYNVMNGQDLPVCIRTSITTAMQQAVNDFDWEVKLVVINFLENIIVTELVKCDTMPPRNVPAYAQQLNVSSNPSGEPVSASCLPCTLKKLHVSRCLSALVQAVDDYDQSVCTEACQSVNKVKDKLINLVQSRGGSASLTENVQAGNDTPELCQQSDSTVNSQVGNENSNNLLNNIAETICPDTVDGLNTNVASAGEQVTTLDLMLKHETSCPNDGSLYKGSRDSETTSSPTEGGQCKEMVGSLNNVLTFDLSHHSAKFTSVCDYNTNPMSLIEDILSYADKPEDDNNVDCY